MNQNIQNHHMRDHHMQDYLEQSKKKVVSKDSNDEPLYEEKQAPISRYIHSGVIMNELKKLGISDEKLVDFDMPIDL